MFPPMFIPRNVEVEVVAVMYPTVGDDEPDKFPLASP